MKEEAAPAPRQLLRETTVNAYGLLKEWVPGYVKKFEDGLDHEWINPIVKTIEGKANPWLEKLDGQISPMIEQVQPLVVQHVQPLVVQCQERASSTAELAKQKKEQLLEKVHSVKTSTTEQIQQVKASTTEQIKQVGSSVQTFTSEQSLKYIHIDLIEYSKQFLDERKPAVDSLYKRFDDTLELMKPVKEKLQKEGAVQYEKVKKETSAQYERIQGLRAALYVRIQLLRGMSANFIARSPTMYSEFKADWEKRVTDQANLDVANPGASELVAVIGPYSMVFEALCSMRDILQSSVQLPPEGQEPDNGAMAKKVEGVQADGISS